MMRRFKKTPGPKDLLQDLLGSYSFGDFKNVPGIQGHHQTREDFGGKEIAGWFLGGKGIQPPAIIVPSSKHYSWPKSASLLGMGHGLTVPRDIDPQKELDILLKNGLINVWVDEKARMNINKRDHRERYIESLEDVLSLCQAHRKPVLLAVAVMGSTEESAVDPL